jgi:alkanesulfonate monooxygenase SsuD/methylene tetrahydromethanopterin reductase-like flavin-dependent oxidoreductase (luciferase family)
MPITHKGRFFEFAEVPMQPPTRHAGGPPIWTGGRSEVALRRCGRIADGWVSYVVTPAMYRDALEKIAVAAEAAGRSFDEFGTAHLLFARVDDSYERAFEEANRALSVRYAMDFSSATKRYAALGKPDDLVAGIRAYYEAGVRHIVLDLVGPYEQRDRQIERIAAEVLPKLRDLMSA